MLRPCRWPLMVCRLCSMHDINLVVFQTLRGGGLDQGKASMGPIDGHRCIGTDTAVIYILSITAEVVEAEVAMGAL